MEPWSGAHAQALSRGLQGQDYLHEETAAAHYGQWKPCSRAT